MLWNNIKSQYILRQIVKDNLKLSRYLELAHYNKKLQEKLDINHENYIDYSEIRIELILNPNQLLP